MKEAVPRRLTNPRAEVVDLSTGVEDAAPVVVFDANIYDEYAAEATSVSISRRPRRAVGGCTRERRR